MDTSGTSEADALLDLARSLSRARPDFGETVTDVEILLAEAAARETPLEVELGLESAARRLRGGWLRSVAAESSRVPRSPLEREVTRLEHSRHDAYGYERDFKPEGLEARGQIFFDAPPRGWTAEHVMFSSGQAALATILLHLAEARPDKLRVAHLGAYFETRELVSRACRSVSQAAIADAVIVEPIACDGRFTTHDPAAIGRSLSGAQVLVIDETLSAPDSCVPHVLTQIEAHDARIVRLVSGLKLLQQGLEFANVGLVSVYSRNAGQTASLAEGLKQIRSLTGAGLRFVDALALEAPFFLDRDATQAYAQRVFAHNAALGQAVAACNRLFKPLSAAGSLSAAAPYCALQLLSGNSLERLEALAKRLEREASARGLLLERGGSFGFRGHRYEVIEPDSGASPFLRVAMGARDGHSCDGVIALMAELAASEPEALQRS